MSFGHRVYECDNIIIFLKWMENDRVRMDDWLCFFPQNFSFEYPFQEIFARVWQRQISQEQLYVFVFDPT